MARDFYEILGVSKGASADELRSAYRKLARKYHPDVNKEPGAQKTFTEVQQAYDVLSDEKKRKVYDQFGPQAFETGGAEAAASRAGGAGPGGAHYRWSNVGGPGGKVNFGDMDMDGEDIGSVFEAIFGQQGGGPFGRQGPAKGARGGRARPAEPEPAHHDITVTFMTAAKGGVEHLRITDEGGKSRSIEVTIPAGVEQGALLRVRSGANGRDLILRVHIGHHPIFRRGETHDEGKGLDLHLDLPLTVDEATLGATVPIPTLTGQLEVHVPQGTASGRKLRLRGKGVHDAKGRQGDLYAVVRIVPPAGKDLTDEEREALRRIGVKAGAVRQGAGWS